MYSSASSVYILPITKHDNIKAVVTSMIQLGLACDLVAVLLPFDCNSTALRPFDDLTYVTTVLVYLCID